MSYAIIIDTETTGIDDPEVIELAASSSPIPTPSILDINASGCTTQRFRPSKPISLAAMAVHHIIDADLVNEIPWPGSWPLPEGVEYIVGHSADFDWKAIGSPHVARICTLALSRSLWPDLDSHSLSAMTYFLRDREQARAMLHGAHSAATDLILCSWLLQDILRMLPGTMSWHQLWQHSERARVPKKMPFGKHKGVPIREVPPDYKRWLLGQPDVDPYLQKALRGEAA